MKKVIFTILFTKLCILTLVICSFFLLPFSKSSYTNNFHYLSKKEITLQTAFSTWDAQYYLYLAKNGYGSNIQANIYFPLLPLFINFFAPFIGYIISGLFVSNLASFFGYIYFYLFVKNFTKNQKIAFSSLLAFLAFPTSFFFSLIYSESIFFLLIMASFYYLYTNRVALAGFISFFLPFSRPTGVFVTVPLFLYVFYDYFNEITEMPFSWIKSKFSYKTSLLLPIIPVIGFISYLIFMQATTGNLFSGLEYDFAKYFFDSNASIHWNFFQNISINNLSLHNPNTSLIDRLFFIFFLFMLPLIWKKTDKTLFSYSFVFGMVPLLGSFMSYTRYLLIVFPLFIVLGIYFVKKKNKELFFSYLYLSLLLQSLFLIMHVLNYWVA